MCAVAVARHHRLTALLQNLFADRHLASEAIVVEAFHPPKVAVQIAQLGGGECLIQCGLRTFAGMGFCSLLTLV